MWVLTAATVGASRVAAADQWGREVRFSEDSEEATLRWQWSPVGSGCDTAGSVVAQDRGDTPVAGSAYGPAWASAQSGTVCHATGNQAYFLGFGEGGSAPYNPPTQGSALAEPVTVRIYVSGHQWAPGCLIWAQAREYGDGPTLQDFGVIADPEDAEPDSPYVSDVDVEMPAGSRALLLVFASACSVSGIVVEELEVTISGDCAGVPGAGSDAGLVFPAAGLFSTTHPQTWGDEFAQDAGQESDACLFTQPGHYEYRPPEGLDEGDTHIFGAEIGAGDGGAGSITIGWGSSTVGLLAVLNFAVHEPSAGTTSPNARNVHTNAPPGAEFIWVHVAGGTLLHGVSLSNVEGDPVQDAGQDGTDGPGPDPTGGAWTNCQPGSDFLAVGEWVAYAACLIAGLPIVIGTVIGGILRDLFVPGPGLAAQFDSTMQLLGSKVPFGWFSEVVDTISSGLAAASSAPVLVFSMQGVTLDLDDELDEALGALAPYRGWFAAGVWFVFALNVHYALMSAVGSPVSREGKG